MRPGIRGGNVPVRKVDGLSMKVVKFQRSSALANFAKLPVIVRVCGANRSPAKFCVDAIMDALYHIGQDA